MSKPFTDLKIGKNSFRIYRLTPIGDKTLPFAHPYATLHKLV